MHSSYKNYEDVDFMHHYFSQLIFYKYVPVINIKVKWSYIVRFLSALSWLQLDLVFNLQVQRREHRLLAWCNRGQSRVFNKFISIKMNIIYLH